MVETAGTSTALETAARSLLESTLEAVISDRLDDVDIIRAAAAVARALGEDNDSDHLLAALGDEADE